MHFGLNMANNESMGGGCFSGFKFKLTEAVNAILYYFIMSQVAMNFLAIYSSKLRS